MCISFDEVHFGGFASKYLHRVFFMDVHPPLAKLSIAAVGWLAGFDGSFDFSGIGREYLYGDDTPVPYLEMRLLCAILGYLTLPVAYFTLRALGLRVTTSAVGTLMLGLDNALTTQSRLILLDSHLVFFTSTSILAYTKYSLANTTKPFSRSWWAWLALTGTSLGLVVSVKYVGLFTIATVGLCTILQLWSIVVNPKVPLSLFAKHFAARAFFLIVWPVCIYIFWFAIHIRIINHSGTQDNFMSSEFQHSLQGHEMLDTFADVAFGSTVTIRHLNTQGGYLHSHPHAYETGSKQQQVTLYPHSDENNEWLVIRAPPLDAEVPTDEEGVPLTLEGPHEIEQHLDQLEWLRNGDIIRLTHRISDKRLHSHDLRPPMTDAEYQNEVSAYGFTNFAGDGNDNWVVEIDTSLSHSKESRERVRALRTVFRLRHPFSGCYLFSHPVELPDWGFGQQEVTCNSSPTRPNTLWFVETNIHPLLEDQETAVKLNYRTPSFWQKFIELQQVMFESNSGLTERHVYDSRPSHWPLLRRGINFWNKESRQVYLLGNPFVWWASVAATMAYLGVRGLLLLRSKRGYTDLSHRKVVFYDAILSFLVCGWAFHYLPFFFMERQLFLHHYLPALYFSVLVCATVLDILVGALPWRWARWGLLGAVILLTMTAWWRIAPLSYASQWTIEQCEAARWRQPWDLDCVNFPNSLTAYATLPPGIKTEPSQQELVAEEEKRHEEEKAEASRSVQEKEAFAWYTGLIHDTGQPPAEDDPIINTFEEYQAFQEEHPDFHPYVVQQMQSQLSGGKLAQEPAASEDAQTTGPDDTPYKSQVEPGRHAFDSPRAVASQSGPLRYS